MGTFSSPHLLNFKERILVNGAWVEDAILAQAFFAIYSSADVMLSYFEYTVLVALWVFDYLNVSACVLEVGLGGRLDATNLIDTDMAIITSIGLDHQAILGNTVEKIAQEKFGIVRSGKPLILGADFLMDVMQSDCESLDVPLWTWQKDFVMHEKATSWCWQGKNLAGVSVRLDQIPKNTLMPSNIACALQALMLSPFTLEADKIVAGMHRIKILGRGESYRLKREGKSIEVMLDVAHNVQAVAALVDRLTRTAHDAQRTLLVFAMCNDKDYRECIALLNPVCSSWYISAFESPRSLEVDDLREVLAEHSIPHQFFDTLAQAFQCAYDHAQVHDRIVVTGSFMTVADVLKDAKDEFV